MTIEDITEADYEDELRVFHVTSPDDARILDNLLEVLRTTAHPMWQTSFYTAYIERRVRMTPRTKLGYLKQFYDALEVHVKLYEGDE